MRILHTSDWHLGHTLHNAGREFEHRAFLAWLIEQLQVREVDALLISGDIFDTANAGAGPQEMWYGFLAEALAARPRLQVVGIAGNHDSAARLEAPDHLLRRFAIRIVGSLPRDGGGVFDPRGLLVPLKDREGTPRAMVIAMPFLRSGDLPEVEAEDPLVSGVAALYGRALEAALPAGLPILAMGHCYLVDGQVSDLSERKILGGNQHALPAALFPEALAYVALGHLHLPQGLGQGRIRYSGSPIPLSMGERHYPHSVTVLDLLADGAIAQEQVRIPRARGLRRVPEEGALPLEEALAALRGLEPAPAGPEPFLEVAVALDKPDGNLGALLEKALEDKGYYLAVYKAHCQGTGQALGDAEPAGRGLQDLREEDVFRRKWERDFKSELPASYLAAFHELLDQVRQEAGP